MILFELLFLVTLFLTGQCQPVFQDRRFTRMSYVEPRGWNQYPSYNEPTPVCDVRTSYINPEMGSGNRLRVKIINCLGLNAEWAFKNTVKAECQQTYVEVKLFSQGIKH